MNTPTYAYAHVIISYDFVWGKYKIPFSVIRKCVQGKSGADANSNNDIIQLITGYSRHFGSREVHPGGYDSVHTDPDIWPLVHELLKLDNVLKVTVKHDDIRTVEYIN